METVERMLFLGAMDGQRLRRYSLDALIALVTALAITGIIYAFKLYPAIPNVSFLYLLAVLGLASTLGLYAAIVTSIVAFFAFDYFLVYPLYTFTINLPQEWLALFIFLVTAIITGRLASALRLRAEQATQRANETLALYELVNATTSETTLERRLQIVAHAVVNNFARVGISDCAILLPDTQGHLVVQSATQEAAGQAKISRDEEKTAELAMREGKIIDLYVDSTTLSNEISSPYRYRRVMTTDLASRSFVRIIPLRLGQNVVGVMRLAMESASNRFTTERNLDIEQARQNPQTTFFWAFLDQAASMIERARLQREALQIELLRRTDALRSALLSSVSHDLRTPLASIKAAASSLLQQDVEWDEEARHSFAQAIEREADRLNRLVGNLLDMSRIEGGALKPEKEWYPIDELIHDVLGHMQFILQDRDVVTTIPDNLPPVELDYLQIDQVMTNLIENAVRYTPAGSAIEVMAQEMDGRIMISVGDHGPGIPPYELERIFDKFYRVSGTAQRAGTMGTGLGLAVCRGLVEAHGGRIWAANRPEGGAVFQFTLPIETEGQKHE